jgi:hypothetical protein
MFRKIRSCPWLHKKQKGQEEERNRAIIRKIVNETYEEQREEPIREKGYHPPQDKSCERYIWEDPFI